MSTRLCLLWAYRCLLQLYPPAFRKRFAVEMLELAEAAEPREWPLIFGDTSVANRALLAAAGGNQFDGGARREGCLPGAGRNPGLRHRDYCRVWSYPRRWFARSWNSQNAPRSRLKMCRDDRHYNSSLRR
jgi:hypothetical protein